MTLEARRSSRQEVLGSWYWVGARESCAGWACSGRWRVTSPSPRRLLEGQGQGQGHDLGVYSRVSVRVTVTRRVDDEALRGARLGDGMHLGHASTTRRCVVIDLVTACILERPCVVLIRETTSSLPLPVVNEASYSSSSSSCIVYTLNG